MQPAKAALQNDATATRLQARAIPCSNDGDAGNGTRLAARPRRRTTERAI
jgi:hypothetical protein